MPEEKTCLPYGLWPSPISAGLISNRLGLEDVQWAADGKTLVWAERRSGGSVLVAAGVGSPNRRDLTDEQTPRGGVGYGGGSFEVSRSPEQDFLVFADRDGRLYRRTLGFGPPRPITPQIGPNGACAAPAISPDGQWVVYVFSDGKTDLLALVDSMGQQWPVQLARGADFYMQPAWHPSGEWLAWVEWDHPNMPWDGTQVMLAHLQPGEGAAPPRIQEILQVGGGADSPAQQPQFSPDGRWLSFIEESDPNSEWPNLVLFDLPSGQRQTLLEGSGFELASPAWVQGVRSYAWSADSQRIFHLRYQGAANGLWVMDVASRECRAIDTAPYTWLAQPTLSPTTDEIALIASGPTAPTRLIRVGGQGVEVIAETTTATFDPAYLPEAREISWSAPDGTRTFALYFPPTNPRACGNGLPPAIVHVHGGPTSVSPMQFNPEAAYFSSRGYAWVTLNYRGSTGYGRSYRNALRQRWGEADVEDAAGLARALADQNLADPHRLVILGGSAGGYTVLNTLIHHPGLFKAGVCQYGVANLFTLDMDTHKFEAHYNHTLVGALPEAAARYHAWSPAFHAARIQDPLYIFQGSEDKVVPPSQSEEIVAALRANRIPHRYKLYEGEGHGFRRSETIADYLKETERFLQQHVLFTV